MRGLDQEPFSLGSMINVILQIYYVEGPQRPPATGALPNFEQVDGVYVSSCQPEQLDFLRANKASATKSNTASATDSNANHHAAIVASGHPRSERPELELSDGTLPSFGISSSDEYPSILSDDFFTALLEPFGVSEEESTSSHGPDELVQVEGL
ncbi:hypothetical protein BDV27DRAFT_160428 [Aspergillus caelatus]|uniref:Uncharacterized protein n=1 Tax=Aspergillus caelatus TaxID=61420 RepID=A0A5N6ZW01_9EURO|nr:uncharacterized protein BDV27DRAFT_160428 [Aspergillus caelatus]KAE8361737.1 hypothetical protein BDV27DRAFT_160428 [Aspergillus caelatus]